MNIIDRTESAGTHATTRDGRQIARPHRSQPLAGIRGAFLHQTSFLNPDPARYDWIIAHYAVLRSGAVLNLRPPTTVLNSVSAGRAVDIEFEGSYPSVRQLRNAADAQHRPRPTVVQLLAGRALLTELRRSLGLTHVWAHRQATEMDRGNCPGPQIWYNVGEWAIAELGLQSSGLRDPIPESWRQPALDLISPLLPEDELSGDDFDAIINDLI